MISLNFKKIDNSQRASIALVLFLFIATVCLALLPTDQKNEQQTDEKVVALVTNVNNEYVESYGISAQGDQEVTVKILEGLHKDKEVTTYNPLMGDPELDWIFNIDDKALVSIEMAEGTLSVDIIGPYRLATEMTLSLIFFVLLILVAGWVGAKAILSFIFSILLIWKILVPACLAGYDPILVSLCVVALLTGAITFLVGGLNRKGATAFLGGFFGLITTCILALVFTPKFYLLGTTRPFAKALLFSHPELDVYRFFVAGIFIASAGAVMDLAMDIAAAMQEIKEHNPLVTRRQLFKSGMILGHAVVGTMTTTLLLAYSGGYMMMLMYFMSQEIPLNVMLNSTFFSSEILNTLVGSFGLVTVAPFSALIGAILFSLPNKNAELKC